MQRDNLRTRRRSRQPYPSRGEVSTSDRPGAASSDHGRRGRCAQALGLARGSCRWAIRWAKPGRIGPYRAHLHTPATLPTLQYLQVFSTSMPPQTPCFTRERSPVRTQPRPSSSDQGVVRYGTDMERGGDTAAAASPQMQVRRGSDRAPQDFCSSSQTARAFQRGCARFTAPAAVWRSTCCGADWSCLGMEWSQSVVPACLRAPGERREVRFASAAFSGCKFWVSAPFCGFDGPNR